MKTLAELRKDANHTQKSLARTLGVAQSTVAGWELGIHKPLASRWQRLAIVLQSDVITMVKMWT